MWFKYNQIFQLSEKDFWNVTLQGWCGWRQNMAKLKWSFLAKHHSPEASFQTLPASFLVRIWRSTVPQFWTQCCSNFCTERKALSWYIFCSDTWTILHIGLEYLHCTATLHHQGTCSSSSEPTCQPKGISAFAFACMYIVHTSVHILQCNTGLHTGVHSAPQCHAIQHSATNCTQLSATQDTIVKHFAHT